MHEEKEHYRAETVVGKDDLVTMALSSITFAIGGLIQIFSLLGIPKRDALVFVSRALDLSLESHIKLLKMEDEKNGFNPENN